jgi:hypothetical protein
MTRKSIVSLGALVVLAAVTGGGARAEDGADAYAKRVFAGQLAPKGPSYACFARRYDANHLAQHPQQKVEYMRLLVSAKTVAEDTGLNYAFSLGVKLRDETENFSNGGECGHPRVLEESAGKLALGCGIDCDGGGLSVEMVNDDKSVLVRTERIALWGSKDSADVVGGDDRVFRLDRVKLDECQPLMHDDDQDEEKPATM